MSDGGGHRGAAIDALAAREYERAGDEYTRAAWATLAEPREGLGPFDADEKGWVGKGLQSLAIAGVAYRVAGYDERATHRAAEGIAVARDLARTLGHPLQAACCGEFVADLRVVGDMDGAEAAYEEAAADYREGAGEDDDPQYWGTTPLFSAATGLIQQVARGPASGEIAVKWENLHGPDPSQPGAFLAHRATYKRQRFAGLVERVVEDGSLAAPRGTTEYGNASYRCPDCASTDVNWTGDAVVCLRCSTPMKPQ